MKKICLIVVGVILCGYTVCYSEPGNFGFSGVLVTTDGEITTTRDRAEWERLVGSLPPPKHSIMIKDIGVLDPKKGEIEEVVTVTIDGKTYTGDAARKYIEQQASSLFKVQLAPVDGIGPIAIVVSKNPFDVSGFRDLLLKMLEENYPELLELPGKLIYKYRYSSGEPPEGVLPEGTITVKN